MSTETVLKAERKFLSLFLPMLFSILVSMSTTLVTVVFAGRLGSTQLAGVGLANTLYNVILVSVRSGGPLLNHFLRKTFAPSQSYYHMFELPIYEQIFKFN